MGRPKNKKGCKVKGCKIKHSSKGFCKKHYTAWWKGFILEDGTFLPHYNPRPIYDRCKYPQCGTRKIKGQGLCQKHYKRAQNGRIDWETCACLDKEWHKRKNHKFEIIKGVEFATPLEKCKLSGCKNKDLKGKGLCSYHYGRVQAGYISESGDRIAKPLVRYREDFQCFISGCTLTHKESKMTLGLCRYHYARYKKGFIDYNGYILKKNKRVASYDGQKCLHYKCSKRPRVRGFCSQHILHFEKGYVDEKGHRIKDPLRYDNRGKVCKIKECNEPALSKRMCQKHYNQMKDNGFIGSVFKNSGHSCSVDNCDKPATALTLCDKHYSRYKKYGQTDIPTNIYKNKNKKCSVDECLNEAKVKGLCNKHYNRLRLTGKLETTRVFPNKNKTCSKCDKPAFKRGYCNHHYYWLVEKPRYEAKRRILKEKRTEKTGTRRISKDDSFGENFEINE